MLGEINMKREFLKELGLEDEQINKIMAEHGNTVNSIKQTAEDAQTKVEQYENDIKEKDEEIKNLKEVVPAQETPEQKEIRELREQIEQGKREAQREKLMSKAVSHASEKGLPTDVVSFFIGEDEDTTMNNLATFEEKFNSAIQGKVDERFKAAGRNPETGASEPDSEGAKFAQQANNQKQTNAQDPWVQGGNE